MEGTVEDDLSTLTSELRINSASPISKLPQELLREIFEVAAITEFFSDEEEVDYSSLLSILRTTKNWNELAKDLLWKRIHITANKRAEKLVDNLDFAWGTKKTVFVAFQGGPGLDSVWVGRVLAGLQGLREVELGHCGQDSLSLEILFSPNLCYLRSLHFHNTGFARPDSAAWYKEDQIPFSLRSLNFYSYQSKLLNSRAYLVFFFESSTTFRYRFTPATMLQQEDDALHFFNSITPQLETVEIAPRVPPSWIKAFEFCDNLNHLIIECTPSELFSVVQAIPSPLQRLTINPHLIPDPRPPSAAEWSSVLDLPSTKNILVIVFQETPSMGLWSDLRALLLRRGIRVVEN